MMNTMGYARRYLSASRESELSALRELLTSGALLSGISALIHALQRERGASTLWLCAEASLTAEALTARRQEADQALAAMIDLLPTP
ncbi:nitrate- and nitrite sensing domain-containing protein, partial [Mixta calida]